MCATAVRHFRRHAYGFPKRWVQVNRLADVDGIHLYRQRSLASMGWPTMSPMAKICGTLVRIWMSTLMKQDFD